MNNIMVQINSNYGKLVKNYLFAEIGNRTKKFIEENPDAPIIKLGIGDTTLPLSPEVIKAFHEGVDDMAKKETYQGYPPYKGHEFLRQLIVDNDYKPLGVDITANEIFVSDGAKCDTANILDIFGNNKTAMTDPSYPVYVDSNVMMGNTGDANENGQYEGILYLPCNEENGFLPQVPDEPVDLIYLCSPNNPTGTVMDRELLTNWVNYAKKNNSIILFDAAYERYISDPKYPRSIFEIDGAKECAIEFRSFSKTAGFTGVRCAFTVIPMALERKDDKGEVKKIHDLWLRRQSTRYNGPSYPILKAASGVYTEEGKTQIDTMVATYMENAKIIREGLDKAGFTYYGGVHSPYIWLKTPNDMSSWDFFDLLLEKLNIVGTPGSGFGPSGKGYFRLTSFGDKSNTIEAIERIKNYKW